MRRLIINADDFGLTCGVNRGIAECCREGVVTSATLMANSGAFGDAVQLSRELTGVSIGCHLTLVDGAPLLPPQEVPSLVRGKEFPQSILAFARAAAGGHLRAAEVQAEVTAQLHTLQQAGIRVSHVDTHKHAHLFPAVLEPLLRAARECGVRALRNPFAPVKPLAWAHLVRRPHLWQRYTEVKLLRRWAGEFREKAAAAGMLTTDGTFGIVVTGALDMNLFRAIAGCIPEGTWELCCHPGYNDAELAGVRTRLRRSRQCELEVLTSAAARGILQQHGIELISYFDLQ